MFISSHILEEMSKLASRIAIIHKGVLLQEITIQEFYKIRQKQLYIGTSDNGFMAKSLLIKEGYQVHLTQNGCLILTDERAVQHPESIARLLVSENIPLSLLKVEEENLESYFLRMVGAYRGNEDGSILSSMQG